jgi:hypothetical protein
MKSEIGSEEDVAGAEAEGPVDGVINTLDDMKDKEIQRVIQNNPDLAEKIRAKVIEDMSAMVGENVTDADFFAFRNDPRWQSKFRETIKRVIDTFEDDIVTLANGGQPIAAPSNAPQILSGDEQGMNVPGHRNPIQSNPGWKGLSEF